MNSLSYSQGRQDIPLLTSTIGGLLEITTEKFPNHEALVVHHQNLRYTWAELSNAAEQLARAFMALGLKVGDRLGIWAPNCAEWCLAQFASAKVGIILVNINPAYRANELEYVLKQSGCRWLICAGIFKTSDYHAMLSSILPELAKTTPGELLNENLPNLRGIISLDSAPPAGFMPWKDLEKQADSVSVESLRVVEAGLHFDNPINIQYTSGTTGFPKGATLSHRNILNNGYMVGESLGLTEHDRIVIPVPLYHCFGMVMGNLACLTHGSTMIYPSDAFDPLATLAAVPKEKATALYGVPTMFIAELDHPQRHEFDLSTLRTGIMAGSTCPIEVMRRVIDELHMGEIQIAYGMTETSPVSLQTRSDDQLELRVTTVGRTQPHLETKLIDASGAIVPRGVIGEICTRGYSVMLGYWQNEKATVEALDSAGWMHTGDLGNMDSNGYITIVGRSKEVIIRGGENIYPREIEEFLFTHPAIADAQVVGIANQKFGEVAIAWVRLHPGNDQVDGEALRQWCHQHIAHYKIPHAFKFVEEFPMTVTGKVQKFRMREISTEELA